MLDRALLYARTARNLRWRQWVYRPLRRVQAHLPVPTLPADAALSPRVAALAEAVRGWWDGADDESLRRADEVMAGRYRFVGHAEDLGEVDWTRRHVSHLWSYNLHYFDYALDLARAARSTGDARYAERLGALAVSWIDANPPGRGDGWEPYPVSLRTVNWAYALLIAGAAIPAPARAAMVDSLAAQLGWLERRLEWHILANHLQKNLKALAVGGLLLAGPDARRWAVRGTRLLWRELFEQVLPDGCHFERSPMYHAIALGDFLEVLSLLAAAGAAPPQPVRDRVARMAEAFGLLSRPDGSLHLFNDAADGIAPPRAWLDRMARSTLGVGVPDPAGEAALPDAGFYGWTGPDERLRIDGGEPGPSYQPGHAHCGLLGFELDLGGRPVVVDRGVSGYDGDPLREYVRSTRAHSTVMIGGREQSEVWGTFRMARRARVVSAEQSVDGDGYGFRGACSPFHAPGAVHRRRLERAGGAWTVTDRVEGATGVRLDSFLHLHPDFTVERDSDAWIARSHDSAVRVDVFGADSVRLVRGRDEPAQGWHCPEFGRAVPAPVLHLRIDRNDQRNFGWRISPVQTP